VRAAISIVNAQAVNFIVWLLNTDCKDIFIVSRSRQFLPVGAKKQ